ncbi:hypothetical protein ACLOJK_033916 [Asimina triloba]
MGSYPCNVDSSTFSKPLPWIGLCVAAASLTQAIAMLVDAFQAFRHRKLWFPCRFFSLSLISSTYLQVSMLLASDLNTTMPRPQDQLAKLSSSVLTCTAIANLMPSLGTVPNSQLGTSMLGLGVLVFTILLNISIQMATGVIYTFLPEHAVIMLLLLFLFVILGFQALIIPTTKQLLEQQHNLKCQQTSDFFDASADRFSVEKLKVEVMRRWMMAHTGNPQFVVARSVACAACGALCLLAALLFMAALLRSLLTNSITFCGGRSDYQWSSLLVLISQSFAILVGSIAPVIRWFHAIGLRKSHPVGGWRQFMDGFQVEHYWVQRLVEWKEMPLPFYIHSRKCRKFMHNLKNEIMCSWIKVQIMFVLCCKFIHFASVLMASWVKSLSCCNRLQGEMGLNQRDPTSLSNFVLLLEGESDSADSITEGHTRDAEKWISRGTNKKPSFLTHLVKRSTISHFNRDKIPWFGRNESPNCWALPMVTFTSITIAIAYSCRTQHAIESLVLGVNEGLKFVTFVEKKMNAKGLANVTEAANIVWIDVDLYKCWIDVDLCKFQGKDVMKTLEKLSDSAKTYMEQSMPSLTEEQSMPSLTEELSCSVQWPPKALAARYMYKVSLTILQHYDEIESTPDADELMEFLQIMIADILLACLTNLPRSILMHCSCGRIETWESSVREAAYLLGEVADVLEYLGQLFTPADLNLEK